tara:strand:+ start:172 stop:402 length:231 start_codon:yes stop_codon:yes gene_type:complete
MNIHELKAELELLYDEATNLRDYTDNSDLASEIDMNVITHLDHALFSLEALVADVDDGMYDESDKVFDFEEDEEEY